MKVAHPFKVRVNLSLVNTMIKKVEEAHRSQRIVSFKDSLLTILKRPGEVAEINGGNF